MLVVSGNPGKHLVYNVRSSLALETWEMIMTSEK
jgi:hypothetical protein